MVATRHSHNPAGPLLRQAIVGLLGVLLVVGASAQSIWKWRDSNGRIQISDRPPPMDVPEKDILLRPNSARAPQAMPGAVPTPATTAPAAAASVALSASAAASLPAVDAELEARRQKAQKEAAEKRQAQQTAAKEKADAIKADNCKRAQSYLTALDNGHRMARVNDKGEREVLDDKTRQAEAQRARDTIAKNCN